MRKIKNLSLLFAVAVGIVVTSGCVSTTLQQIRESSSEISDHESIAILGRLHKSKEETEIDFVDCVSSRTSMGENGLNVLTSQAFLDSFFPWFEPRTAPRETKELVQFLDTPLLVKRFRDIGLRYIVWIDGQTERVDQSGTLQCAIATSGVPACFGFLSWDGQSNYEATVWDIERGITVGKLSSEASGTSFVPAIIVPVPFIARVQATACRSLADQLKSFISGTDPQPV